MDTEKNSSAAKFEVPYFRPPPLNSTGVIPKIEEILNTRIFSKGLHRYELEDALKKYLDADFIISCSSGTAGLFILLKAAKEVYKFSSISMPCFTWQSDLISVEAAGFACASSTKVYYCDIDKNTWNLSFDKSHKSSNSNSHLILVQDTFGNIDISNSGNENIIVDATHSLGAKNIGSRGLGEVISLAPTKPVTAGEGGIITTNDRKIAKRAIEIRDLTARLPEISCTIALQYLNQLPANINAKRAIAQYYRSHLPFPFQKIEHDSTYSKVCFLCAGKEESEGIIKKAGEAGIECRKYYKPLIKGLKNTDDVYNRILCLPAYVGVDYKRVTEAITKSLPYEKH